MRPLFSSYGVLSLQFFFFIWGRSLGMDSLLMVLGVVLLDNGFFYPRRAATETSFSFPSKGYGCRKKKAVFSSPPLMNRRTSFFSILYFSSRGFWVIEDGTFLFLPPEYGRNQNLLLPPERGRPSGLSFPRLMQATGHSSPSTQDRSGLFFPFEKE